VIVWPVIAVVGFVVLAALVVALAQSSTARYEFERNQVQGQQKSQQQAETAVLATAGAVVGSGEAAAHPVNEVAVVAVAAQDQWTTQGAPTAGLAAHPAGKRVADQGPSAWWLVAKSEDHPSGQVVAGPYPDRIEAEWAGLAGAGQPVHGVRRADGRVVRRQLPEERAWLSDLSDQLDRLPAEWDHDFADDDELVTLVVEVASALVESGLPLHDCVGEETAGGVCLSPEPGRPGIVVSWHQHHRASSEDVRSALVHAAVQAAMNLALAEVLLQLGFEVEPFGDSGCSLVVAGPR
jgi:type II secretory pathway pseudopilin PulG